MEYIIKLLEKEISLIREKAIDIEEKYNFQKMLYSFDENYIIEELTNEEKELMKKYDSLIQVLNILKEI